MTDTETLASSREEEIRALALRFYDRHEEGDAAGVIACFKPGTMLEYNLPRPPRPPESLYENMKRIEELTSEHKYIDRKIHVTADGFIQQHVMRAVRRDGPVIDVPMCIVASVEDGLISKFYAYADSATLMSVTAGQPAKGEHMNDEVAAKVQCAELVVRMGVLLDLNANSDAADLFSEDGVFKAPISGGKELKGPEIRAFFEARPTNIVTRHIITNVIVTPTGPETAEATAYALIYAAQARQTPPHELPKGPHGAGNWALSLVKKQGAWKIKNYAATPVMLPADGGFNQAAATEPS